MILKRFYNQLYILHVQGRLTIPSFKTVKKVKSKMKKVTLDEKEMSYRSRSQGTKPNQEQIDAILDKISQSGYDSLNKEEKEILFKASE
jgi:hypothetical protein